MRQPVPADAVGPVGGPLHTSGYYLMKVIMSFAIDNRNWPNGIVPFVMHPSIHYSTWVRPWRHSNIDGDVRHCVPRRTAVPSIQYGEALSVGRDSRRISHLDSSNHLRSPNSDDASTDKCSNRGAQCLLCRRRRPVFVRPPPIEAATRHLVWVAGAGTNEAHAYRLCSCWHDIGRYVRYHVGTGRRQLGSRLAKP